MSRRFFDTSAEAVGTAGHAAYQHGDVTLLREAISELSKFRATGEARRIVEGLAPLLNELEGRTSEGHQPDDGVQPSKKWLTGVQKVAGRYALRESAGSCSVYLVLLRGPHSPDGFGVYVGETGLTAEARFYQHKTGIHARPIVRDYGVRLLRPFFDHLEGTSREDAKNIERELAVSLSDAGYWVKGGH